MKIVIFVIAFMVSTFAQAGSVQCRVAEQTGQWAMTWASPDGFNADLCVLQVQPGGVLNSQLSDCANTQGAIIKGTLKSKPNCSVELGMSFDGQRVKGIFVMNRTRDILSGFLFDAYDNFMGTAFIVKQ